MKDIREGVCPLCGHNEIIEAWPKAGVERGAVAFPIAVAWEKNWLGRDKSLGVLAVFVCRQCGKAEGFAANPAEIEIGPEFNTA